MVGPGCHVEHRTPRPYRLLPEHGPPLDSLCFPSVVCPNLFLFLPQTHQVAICWGQQETSVSTAPRQKGNAGVNHARWWRQPLN